MSMNEFHRKLNERADTFKHCVLKDIIRVSDAISSGDMQKAFRLVCRADGMLGSYSAVSGILHREFGEGGHREQCFDYSRRLDELEDKVMEAVKA